MPSDRAPSDATQYRYRFGSAEFDESKCELRIGGLQVEVQRKPLEVLALLLRRCGEVVTKDELFEAVWPGVVTVENVLANAVSKLRSALGEENAARIATLARNGYRLDGPVERIAAGRRLRSSLELRAGERVPLRANFVLETHLDASPGSEVWLARQAKTREARVYKFCGHGDRLAALKREATLSRVLAEGLGTRRDLVRVIDWNFESAPFFLEIEYGGQDLAKWAQAGQLASTPQAQRLEIFVQIAEAVAAAHSVGVLHKDLKPSNVLLRLEDGSWRAKVADFGSGRLMDSHKLREFGITSLGLTLTQGVDADSGARTPLYAAPELLAGASPTAQGDVYALGLILFQMMVGDLHRPMAPGWERDVSDALLRADIAEATDVDPARRMAGAASLAQRLRSLDERHTECKRQRLIAEKHAAAQQALARSRARRPWVAAAACTMVAGFAVSSFLYVRTLRATQELDRQYETLRTLNRFLTDDLIGAANPDLSGHSKVTVAQAAMDAAGRIDREFGSLAPETRAQLHAAMQRAFTGLAEYSSAAEEGRRAEQAYETLAPVSAPALIDVQLRLASNLSSMSKFDEAKGTLRKVEYAIRAQGLQRSELQVRLLYARSQIAGESLAFKEQLAGLQDAWNLAGTLPAVSDEVREAVELHLANAYSNNEQLKKGEDLMRDLLAFELNRYGAPHPRTLFTEMGLGDNLADQGRYRDANLLLTNAVDGLARALGPDHHKTLEAKFRLASLHFQIKEYATAAGEFAEVYRNLTSQGRQDQDFTIVAQGNWAVARFYEGQPRVAEPIFRQALESARRIFPETSPRVQDLRYHLADCLLDLGSAIEAASLLHDLDANALNVADPEPDWPGLLAYQAGRVSLAQGDRSKARRLLEWAQQSLTEKDPDGRVSEASIRRLLRP